MRVAEHRNRLRRGSNQGRRRESRLRLERRFGGVLFIQRDSLVGFVTPRRVEQVARHDGGGVVPRDEHRERFSAVVVVVVVVFRARIQSPRPPRRRERGDASSRVAHRRRFQSERFRVERQHVARAPRAARRGGAQRPRARRDEDVPAARRRRRRRSGANSADADAARSAETLSFGWHLDETLDGAERPVARRREERGARGFTRSRVRGSPR